MARMTLVMMVLSSLVAVLAAPTATPPVGEVTVPEEQLDRDMAPDEVVSGEHRDEEMAADEALDEEEMQERMLDLLFRLWDSGDLAVDIDPPQALRTKRSTVVFRPLWVTRERSSRRLRLGYRSPRVGRAVMNPTLTRAARSLPAAITSPKSSSRVRRQGVPEPLLASQQGHAGWVDADREVADEEPRPAPEEGASRVRREWADVPLFAAKQIHAERILEEHPGYRRLHGYLLRRFPE